MPVQELARTTMTRTFLITTMMIVIASTIELVYIYIYGDIHVYVFRCIFIHRYMYVYRYIYTYMPICPHLLVPSTLPVWALLKGASKNQKLPVKLPGAAGYATKLRQPSSTERPGRPRPPPHPPVPRKEPTWKEPKGAWAKRELEPYWILWP